MPRTGEQERRTDRRELEKPGLATVKARANTREASDEISEMPCPRRMFQQPFVDPSWEIEELLRRFFSGFGTKCQEAAKPEVEKKAQALGLRYEAFLT